MISLDVYRREETRKKRETNTKIRLIFGTIYAMQRDVINFDIYNKLPILGLFIN